MLLELLGAEVFGAEGALERRSWGRI